MIYEQREPARLAMEPRRNARPVGDAIAANTSVLAEARAGSRRRAVGTSVVALFVTLLSFLFPCSQRKPGSTNMRDYASEDQVYAGSLSGEAKLGIKLHGRIASCCSLHVRASGHDSYNCPKHSTLYLPTYERAGMSTVWTMYLH